MNQKSPKIREIFESLFGFWQNKMRKQKRLFSGMLKWWLQVLRRILQVVLLRHEKNFYCFRSDNIYIGELMVLIYFFQIIVKSIVEEINGDVFCLMVDESSDVSGKEHMAVVLRYVDKLGIIKERLIGVVHVSETSASCLKSNIDVLFAKYGLSIKQVRGQGYDGDSNMRGEFNGLRALIMRENSSAYILYPLFCTSTAVSHCCSG